MESFAAHGLAGIASATPVTEDTAFRIASVTRTFTAIAVLQLWERLHADVGPRSFHERPTGGRR